MEIYTTPLVVFLVGIVVMIIGSIIIIYRNKEKTRGEGCMSLLVLAVLWAALCSIIHILYQTINK